MPLSDLHPFEGHPFKVLDDETMQRTVESMYYIQSRFIRPKVRPYQTHNYYALLMKGDEVHDSVSEKE